MKEISSGLMILAIGILGYFSGYCPQNKLAEISPKQKIACSLSVLNQPDDPPKTNDFFRVNSSLSAFSASATVSTGIITPSPSPAG